MEFILLTAAGSIILVLVLIAWRDHGRWDITWYGKYSSQEERRVEVDAHAWGCADGTEPVCL